MTKSVFYTIWHDILKMCNNRFYLSYHQSLAKWKNLFLVTYRLPFITLAFSFALGDYCRIPPEFSASFKQLWVNPILTHMHPPTHTHTHTRTHARSDIHSSVWYPDLWQMSNFARLCLFWHILCQNVPLEFISVYVSRLSLFHYRICFIIPAK